MHDGLTQTLSIASLNLKNLPYDFPAINDQTRFTKAIKYLESAIDDSRSIAHRIMPKTMQDFGLISSLLELIENTREVSHIHIRFDHNIEVRLDQEFELNLFRIVQEAINNILHHADATEIRIFLWIDEFQLSLNIEDNGRGMDEAETKKGFGIRSMKSRAAQMGGTCEINNKQDGGTKVSVSVPIERILASW